MTGMAGIAGTEIIAVCLLKIGVVCHWKHTWLPSRISIACIAAEMMITKEHDGSMTWRNVFIVLRQISKKKWKKSKQKQQTLTCMELCIHAIQSSTVIADAFKDWVKNGKGLFLFLTRPQKRWQRLTCPNPLRRSFPEIGPRAFNFFEPLTTVLTRA